MTGAPQHDNDRLLELLADRAVQPLNDGERAELDDLLRRNPGFDAESVDRAAAALAVALTPPEPLPRALGDRLRATADAGAGGRTVKFPAAPAGRWSLRGALFAAAACLAWASGATFWGLTTASRLRSEAARARAQAETVSAEAAGLRQRLVATAADLEAANQRIAQLLPLDPDEARAQRERLLAEAPDAMTLAWQPWDNPAMVGVGGDVVWSNAEQKGFLRFTGLPRNDPGQSQYQLWIIDGERGMEQRISGGVFDISAEGEVVIPIDPGLAVKTAAAFAVTVEQPSGTWVSDMTRKAVIAAAK